MLCPFMATTIVGPQLRSPTGGNFMKEAKARASAAELIIGAMTAEAPRSRTREAIANWPTGILTMLGLPAKAT